MISLTPTGSPAETNAASTLLDIIANPDRAKKHLDALIAEKQAASEVMQTARQASKDAEAAKKEAARLHADATQMRAAAEDEYNIRAKQLSDHAAVLTTKQKQIEEYDAAVTKRESDLAAREAAVKAREDDVLQREAITEDLAIDARSLKSEFERKYNQLRAAMD